MWILTVICGLWTGALATVNADSFTLSDLQADRTLTPKKFANLFRDFYFEPCPVVQPPDVFLESRRGDCDDYAVLADFVLSQKGYQTRLVRILFAGTNIGHAVCYVAENRAYLDYNNRKYFINLERSAPSLREIATKVSASLELNWTTVAEYAYSYDRPRNVIRTIIAKTDPPELDPDRGR